MKLIRLIMNRLSLILFFILSLWTLLFCVYLERDFLSQTDLRLNAYAEEEISLFLSDYPDVPLAQNDPAELISHSFVEIPASYARQRQDFSLSTLKYAEGTREKRTYRRIQIVFKISQDRYFLFQAQADIQRQRDLQNSIYGWVLILYFLLLVIILIVNYFVIEKNMQPLYRLLAWIDRFDIEKENSSPGVDTKVKEFSKLSRAVERQFERTQVLYRQQKFFVDNAAHEMQTPVAVCLNRIEQLLQKPDLDETLFLELASVLQTLKKMARMQKDLLQLSRIENGAYTQRERVSIRPLARQAVENLQEIFASKNIACRYGETGTGPEEPMEKDVDAVIDPVLCRLLVDNLLKNAFVHTPPNGEIRIFLAPDRFSVSNSGSSPLPPGKIFERFYQQDSSKGTAGLGLAICQAICQEYGLQLSYSFEDGMHCFQVTGFRKLTQENPSP